LSINHRRHSRCEREREEKRIPGGNSKKFPPEPSFKKLYIG